MDQGLKEAAEAGNTDALYNLLRQDAYLLERVDQIPFADTPLHIAASSGHIEFAMEILNLKASFARKLNQDGFSPMHLALKNNHNLMVLLLVDADSGLIRVKGRKGMTPLHFAAESGNSSVLAEFFDACPESIKDVTNQGDTALHIAVKHKKIEALKVLLGWLERSIFDDNRFWKNEILNWRNQQGCTVLHIAVLTGQGQAVKTLFKIFDIDASIKDKEGRTAIYHMEVIPTQFNKNYKIRQLMHEAALKFFPSATKLSAKQLTAKLTCKEYYKLASIWLKSHYSSDNVNALLVVDALIATMTYQGALSPPGGVWQGTADINLPIRNNIIHVDNNTIASLSQEANPSCYVGTTVMGSDAFGIFWCVNTYVFFCAIIRIYTTSPNLSFFPPMIFLLFSCYLYSMSVISPTKDWSKANLYLFYGVIIASVLRILYQAYQFLSEFKEGSRSGRSRLPMREREEWWQ